MIITQVRNRVMPAVFALSALTMANTAMSQNKNINQENNNTQIEIPIEEQSENENKKTMDWKSFLLLFTIGMAGGVAGTRAIQKYSQKKGCNQNDLKSNEVYFTKRFEKDADKLYDYMQTVMTETIANKSNKIDSVKFYRDTHFFYTKYPSREPYITKFAIALGDFRLNQKQKETLCLFLMSKATCSSNEEQEDTKLLYPYFDGIDNDYEKMVNAVRTNQADVYYITQDESEEGASLSDSERVFNTVNHNLTFKDVGGQEEAIKTLKRNILFPIKYPNAFKHNSMNHGFLLYGAPGTGKTLVSEALANEANANFVKLNGNELTSKWVGESEENWRKLFQQAKEKQPTIILIDEFDGVASKRGEGDVYNDKLVNQILGLLSDVEKNNYQVYVIATTNRKDMIDKAILRPGRLGMHIELKPPQTSEEVTQILNIYLNKRSHSKDINLEKLSNDLLDKHATGADIAYIINSAYENAMERNLIYEKMDNGTFTDSDMQNVIITAEDIEKVMKDFNTKDKKRTMIGFTKQANKS